MSAPPTDDPTPQDRDPGISRRQFLERGGYAAGLAGMASLPASTLMSQAARAAARSRPLPAPDDVPIEHFVVVMMENRSFDHYFGWASSFADAKQHQRYRDHETGKWVETFHAAELGDNRWQGCGFRDPGHDWDQGRAQLRRGFLGRGSGNDKYALCYYEKGELEFIHRAALSYTLCDRYHCSLLGPTYPNRYYMWSAQSGGHKDNSLPSGDAGYQWETLFDRAQKHNPTNTPEGGGPTYRYYHSDLPFAAVWGPRAVPWTRRVYSDYFDACESGTLENIVYVDPPFTDGSGGDGLSQDEHPHGDVRGGQSWMSQVVRAFVNSPNYRNGALFIVYDEWGGFFDHVRPPSVADDRKSRDLYRDFGQMGFRTPAVIVSPYTLAGSGPRVSDALFGHESIIKLITYKFGLGNLVRRDAAANSIGHAFDFGLHDTDPADLPLVPPPVTEPCSVRERTPGAADSVQEYLDELKALRDLAEKYGFSIGNVP